MTRFPPKKILVPMDFSEPSRSAMKVAKSLAEAWGSAIELLYVQPLIEKPLYLGLGGAPVLISPTATETESLRRRREKDLRRAAGGLIDGIPESRVRVRTLTGWPPARLSRLAEAGTSDLIVMGTHGFAGFDRFAMGSVAESVIRRSHTPVLTVHRRPAPSTFSRILVPCNMTPYADKALVYAERLGRSLGARLCALYVAKSGSGWTGYAKRLLESHLNRVLGDEHAGEIVQRIRQGDPRPIILEEAKNGRFDLIVLSAHRRRFSADFVLGSTVERTLRHAETPVLAIPSVESEPPPPRRAGYPPKWLADKIH